MRPNADGYMQVAGRRTVHTRPAFAAQTDTLPVIDTGGNIDFHRLDRLIPPRATAFDARFFNVFARTVAGRTSLLHTENRLLDVHRTRTLQVGQVSGDVPGFAPLLLQTSHAS